MKIFLDGINLSLQTSNWISALSMSLTIPDIAGKIEYPMIMGRKRYIDWFDKYVAHKYRTENELFLSGNDCYAFRCSLLHEGISDISHQQAKKRHDNFIFVVPQKNGLTIHNNIIDNFLQLRIDLFSKDIIDSCNQWLDDISFNTSKQREMKNMFSFIDTKDLNDLIMII